MLPCLPGRTVVDQDANTDTVDPSNVYRNSRLSASDVRIRKLVLILWEFAIVLSVVITILYWGECIQAEARVEYVTVLVLNAWR